MYTLDEIIEILNKYQQRATYGAVAGVLGRPPRGLMTGRDICEKNSWVVARRTNNRTGARRGWPTGYKDKQIHRECKRQIDQADAGIIKPGTRGSVIEETEHLERFLRNPANYYK